MISKLQKLTDGMIFFSALISDYERLDFKNDALGGVRANYFNSNNSAQSEKTEVVFDGKIYNLSYFMIKNEPLSWKITRNNRPYQTVKRATGGIYCVIVYGDNGIINKRQYFDDKHNWIRTEYYDKNFENVPVATLMPKTVSGISVLRLEQLDLNGERKTTDLYPSSETPTSKCRGLVYSNVGMVWYDESFKPEGIEETEISAQEKPLGFKFKAESFANTASLPGAFDLTTVEYLEDEVVSESEIADTEPKIEINTNEDYSAYDKIEKILSEAHKSNKDLFGEILNQASGKNSDDRTEDIAEEETSPGITTEEFTQNEVIEEIDIQTEEAEVTEPVEIEKTEELEEITEAEETPSEEAVNDVTVPVEEPIEEKISEEATQKLTDDSSENTFKEAEDVTDDIIEENVEPEVISEIHEAVEEKTISEPISEFEESVNDTEFKIAENPDCNVVIHTKTGRYSYYGELDSNNCRTGKGRTVTPQGLTSYDGEYSDDKRHGFGICYYKEGDINYVGNWDNGNRCGCGVGYRHSDGTLHAGKWNNNTPDGFGARFDKEGNFIEACSYTNGVKDGKSISFDDNGNVVIKKWKDGELVLEQIIKDED